MAKPKSQDIEFWKKELPVGSRISWGAWGRGTIIETETKIPVAGKTRKPYYSFTAKFDGDRYNLLHRGVNMGPAGVNKLKNDAKIRFGTYCNGRAYPYTLIEYGDIVRYNNNYNYNDATWPLYMYFGGVYDGIIHKGLLVPVEDADALWCEIDVHKLHKAKNESIWIDVEKLRTDNQLIKLIKAHDPYRGQEGSEPDSVSVLLRDRLTDEEHMRRREYVVSLFNKFFKATTASDIINA